MKVVLLVLCTISMVCYSIQINEIFGRFFKQRKFMQGLLGEDASEKEVEQPDQDLI